MKGLQAYIVKLLTNKKFQIVIGLFIAYLAFSWLAVDPLARKLLPWLAERNLASKLEVERVRFDPLRLILEIDNLRLARIDGAPLAGFEHLHIDFETNGIFKWAWRFRDIRLMGPQVALDIAPDGRFNWSDLLERLNDDVPKEESTTIARVLIDHLQIERGNITYEERNRDVPFRAVLQPLGLELDGLSTLPQDRGGYALLARLPEQGGTLKWKGELGLNPLISSGEIELEGVKLANLAQIIRTESSPFNVASGDLDTKFEYHFSLAKGEVEPFPYVRIESLDLTLGQIAASLMSPEGVSSAIELERFYLQLPTLTYAKPAADELRLQGLAMSLQQFKLTHQDRVMLGIHDAEVHGVGFDLTDNQLQVEEVLLNGGMVNALRDKDGGIDWQKLVVASQTPGEAEFSTVDEGAETNPLHFTVGRVQLEQWQIDYQDETFRHPLKMSVKELGLGFSLANPDGEVEIQGLNSRIEGIGLHSALYSKPVASLSYIHLVDGHLSLKESSVNLTELLISGLKTEVRQEPGKPLNWAAILETAPVSKKAQASSEGESSDWKFAVNRFALDEMAVHIEDRSTKTPTVIDVQNASVELKEISQDLSRVLPVKARLPVRQGGVLEVGGKLALAPVKVDLQVHLRDLALKTFSPYINQAATLKLEDGSLGLKGKLALNYANVLKGHFQGGFNIRQLAITEEDTGAAFLTWKEISSDTLDLGLSPGSLHVDELRIAEPAGKFIIYEDGTMNVKRILRVQDAVAESVEVPEANTQAQASDGFKVVVERVRVADADLEFADLTLTPQFGTHINSLSGVINGLSNDPGTTAQVELDGKVEEFGMARIRGSVQPFQVTDFTDLKLTFRNLEMNRLTPYSGKFAGRRIDSGKLSVDLEYKINQRQLAGENKFLIEKLQLGERVESPDAMSLPLDLAIALLEDSNGLIDLDLPISGSLDDPQFSYGKIIWKAVVNVLTKIVTSPFQALAKLIGVDTEKLQDVAFDAGAADLAPQEREKLKAVAEAMGKRPTLILKLIPAFDPEADKTALQRLKTRRDVLLEMGLKLEEGEQPGPVDIANTKAQSAIDRLLKIRAGESAGSRTVDALKDYFRKSKPEDLPIYEEKLKQLEATVEIPEAELQQLAISRANAMREYILTSTSLDAPRVNLGGIVPVKGNGDQVSLRMELGVMQEAMKEALHKDAQQSMMSLAKY